ncbi:MAG: TSUP family transporter [Luteibaculaceae bacterium]
MDAQTILTLAAIGLVAGIFSGFIGIGGGVIIVPALVFFLAMSQTSAQGTSLAMMLPPIGALAVYNYYKAGEINITYAIILTFTFFIGGYVGSKIALSISPLLVKRIFAVFLLLVAARMLFSK